MAAEKGNRYAEVHSLNEWIEIYNKVYENTVKGLYNSLQEAFIKNGVRPSTYRYLASKHKELANIKEDINDALIVKINNRALEGDFNATAGIWRMKQLGERDEKYQDVTTKGETINQVNLGSGINPDESTN